MQNAPKIQCPEPLLFFFADDYKRYRIAYGGRSSGKSWTAAQGLIVRALRSKIRILCCREIQNSIKQSVKKTIGRRMYAHFSCFFFQISRKELLSLFCRFSIYN